MEDLYDGGVGVYSEAKGEYTKQLIQFLTPALSRFFMKLLAQAQADMAAHGGRGLLAKFQELMSAVPEWNIDKVQRETGIIIGETKCDYLEELLSAVFIAHTKVLTAIRPHSWKNKKVQIVVPKMDHFIHRAMSESCRLLWKAAYLFQQDLPAIDKQKNYRGVEMQIGEGISNAIRGLLPVKNILKDCLAKTEEDDSDSDSDSDDEGVGSLKEPVVPATVPVQEPTPAPEPTPEPVQTQVEETKDVAKPLEDIKVEKLEEVAIIHADGSVEAPANSTEDMSGNDHVFIKPEVKGLTVEKLDEIPDPLAATQQVEEPSVKFNDYDQVYTPIVGGGGSTSLEYAPKNEDESEDYQIDVLGDSASVISDVEDFDLSLNGASALGDGDYEEL
jgi:hypothetical protein